MLTTTVQMMMELNSAAFLNSKLPLRQPPLNPVIPLHTHQTIHLQGPAELLEKTPVHIQDVNLKEIRNSD